MTPLLRALTRRQAWAALLSLAAFAPSRSFGAVDALLPPALRGVDPRRISSGVYRALTGTRRAAPAPRAASVPPEVGLAPASGLKATPPAVLDARVSPNLKLGADPSQLPAGEIDQAEPFIYRSVANPDLVLAVFQEGRFGGAEGGSADGGYALSTDGGFTWARSLVPGLSQVTGGTYFRSTDPVSAIDLQGDLFLSTLEARDSGFTLDDLVISRSTDGGATWTQHVAYSTPNAQIFADKDWMAVNDYAGTAHVGRLVATCTGFVVNAQGSPTTNTLFSTVSDDQGDTWSPTAAITPSGGNFQGTQPYFLPDGTLVCVYQSYASVTSNVFAIECSRSSDGGSTWAPAVVVAPNQVEFDDPVARTGGGLPGVAVARQAGTAFATWQVASGGSGHIVVSRSGDGGATWTAPVVVSDNAAAISVFNPAVTVTPDGTAVTVVFYDKRLGLDPSHYVDLFATQSFDGGATWSPEFRVSDYTTDLQLTVLSDTGFMLGDYLGIAPALAANQGTIPIWCDTRYGNSDPFIARLAPTATATFSAWQTVRFTRAQQADATVSGPSADPDSDGYGNLAEYALGTDPLTAESGGCLALVGAPPGPATTQVGVTWTERTTDDFVPSLQVSSDGGATWTTGPGAATTVPAGATATANATIAVPAGGASLIRLAFTQSPAGATVAAPDHLVANGTSTLANLSCRGPVGSGASQLIAGFVAQGADTSVLIRAAGPALAAFGVSGFLTDPVLTVQDTATAAVVASNDNWGTGPSAEEVATLSAALGAFPFAAGSLDSALVASLPAGGYTAAVAPAPGASGSVTLAEIYDADGPSAGRLVNVSTRGAVGTGPNVMIAGFVIAGPQPKRVLLRAIGPSLAQFGVAGTLGDPELAVFDGSGTQIASNDDWSVARSMAATAATESRVGAFPLAEGSLDSALVLTLAPGPYTVQVSGVGAETGNALVEIYDAD